MSIKDKTRKSLWAKSGNKCAICKTNLFSTHSEARELNIGEECHIISSKINGPRYKTGIKDYDTLDNLILLCANHHKEIDELKETYTEEILRYVKLNHENWVQSSLENITDGTKNQDPKFLFRITSGKELLNIISGSHGYRMDYEEVENEKDAEYVGEILQTLVDYGDISRDMEMDEKVKTGFYLGSILEELEEKGFCLFGEKSVEKIKNTNGEKYNWSIATLIIRRISDPKIIKIPSL
jgi:hypothetical protein